MRIRGLSARRAASRRTVWSWRVSLLVWAVAAGLAWAGVALLLHWI